MSALAISKRIAIVTGGNKGIGLEIVRKLSEVSDIKTILAARSVELGTSAAQLFEGSDVEFLQLDISSSESIIEFTDKIRQNYGRCDILINNAAIAFKDSDPTPFRDQAEPTLHTNFFGTLELTSSLLPLLKQSPHPRIVNIASQAGHLRILPTQRRKDFFTSDDLTIEDLCKSMREFVGSVKAGRHKEDEWPSTCYGTSKLAVIAYTRILARLEPTIKVNACCPGWCQTDMSSLTGYRTAAQGAETPVALALALEADDGPTGGFYYDGNLIKW